MRVYQVRVEQRYEVLASDAQDAADCVEAIYDRATGGRDRVVFDDDTEAALISTELVDEVRRDDQRTAIHP